MLGETIVSSVVPGGQADHAIILELDCVVAVNGEYTAFLSHEQCLSRLVVQVRPMVVVFARPIVSVWNRIAKEIDGPIKSGLLEKDMVIANIFSKGFQARQFALTKQTLSYSTNDVLRKKMALEDVLRVVPTLSVAVDRDRVFELVTREKSLELRAGSPDDKISWLHMIECAKNRAFDRPLPEPRNAPSSSSDSAPTQQRNLPPPAMRVVQPPAATERGLYWALQYSQVRISGSNAPDLSLPPLPTSLNGADVYSFAVEEQVLAAGHR